MQIPENSFKFKSYKEWETGGEFLVQVELIANIYPDEVYWHRIWEQLNEELKLSVVSTSWNVSRLLSRLYRDPRG